MSLLHYRASPATDLLLARWWEVLQDSRDFGRVFSQSTAPLSAFLAYFQLPRVLAYDTDDSGIAWACWFDPLLSGAAVGLWVTPHLRRTRWNLERWDRVVSAAFRQWPVLFSITRHPEIARSLERLGYTALGRVPFLLDGHDVQFCYLTRAGHETRRAAWPWNRPARMEAVHE